MRIQKKFFGLILLITLFLSGLSASIVFVQTSQFKADHFGTQHGCHSDVPLRERSLLDCTINPNGGRPIYLIGDSNADQFSEALVNYAQSSGRKLVIGTISGCPFLPGYVNAPNHRWPSTKPLACSKYFSSTLEYLARAPSGVVVLAYSDQYFRERGWQMGFDNLHSSLSLDTHLIFLRKNLFESVSKIRLYGHKVLFIFTIPQLNYKKVKGGYVENLFTPQLCSFTEILFFHCDRETLMGDYEASQLPTKNVESEVLNELGILTLDFKNNLSVDGKILNRSHLNWIYKDGAHISVSQSAKLSKIFQHKLAST